ncbi:GNAT family N-acetyltransferase [Serinibacter salmoneus]|uniref:RimJ/RimL family protein N-acetyltransferase n=1 Tax=Serinibacter salmoneus TaxID=556530 RepID=A0A2A9D0M9_9MICO|nr:GNAT family protein [Serinibacter salmoneus]PFG19399.1 RimJ/RimL family protein N-acetyltransferase [Serinibacter salmoneus]
MLPDDVFAAKPMLIGQRVVLRPFEAADIEAMGPILADPEVLRLTGSVTTSRELEEARPELGDRVREWYETRADQADRLDLAIIDREAGACVGEVVLNDVRAAEEACNLRILIGPAGRGRGLGTEAVRLIVDHAFATTSMNRISLDVLASNPRARRAYERVGFIQEGVLVDDVIFDGEREDSVLMALLRRDWQRGR